MPARSSTPVVTVAVYRVLGARGDDGWNVAVKSVSVTVPGTWVEPAARRKVAVVIVAGSIASVKVAFTDVSTSTSVSVLRGCTDCTSGRVTSGAGVVVK